MTTDEIIATITHEKNNNSLRVCADINNYNFQIQIEGWSASEREFSLYLNVKMADELIEGLRRAVTLLRYGTIWPSIGIRIQKNTGGSMTTDVIYKLVASIHPENDRESELRVRVCSSDNDAQIRIEAWYANSQDLVVYLDDKIAESLVAGLQQAVALLRQGPA
jgi:hypothetical protein